ncbi:MAG: calcium/sodium antiporter [Thermoanaerobaculum sp.]|nr:calcium/sodium antiporter [Thermoanaerobaculum sp.]
MTGWVAFLLGLGLLVVGAEALVRGASRLALQVGISPLVVGLTVVAFGTSSPEVTVTVRSALLGEQGADVALGNVVGSNIANILLILGASALLRPLQVRRQLVRVDVPIMIGCSVLVLFMALDGRIRPWEGGILSLGIVAYTAFAVRLGRQDAPKEAGEGHWGELGKATVYSWAGNLALVGGGLGALLVGSNWFVEGAIFLARTLGVSELVIGLTVVAVGTSSPEIATSLLAAVKGERDIAVGNAVGSNIFNLLAVLGPASVVSGQGLRVSPAALHFDLPVMLAVAVACLPIFLTGELMGRWEGLLFLTYYGLYLTYLWLKSAQHDLLAPFSAVMGFFVLPLTAVTLVGIAFWSWYHPRRGRPGKSNRSALLG